MSKVLIVTGGSVNVAWAKEETHVLKVHLIVVIMIVRSVEGEVFAV